MSFASSKCVNHRNFNLFFGDSGVVSDPFFSSVVLLLNGTDFSDHSSQAQIIDQQGGITLTPGGPFGTTNAYLLTPGWLRVADIVSLRMGAGDFTWEIWANSSFSHDQFILFNGDSTAFNPRAGIYDGVAANGGIAWFLGGAPTAAKKSTVSDIGAWYYIAYSRVSGNGSLYFGKLGDANTVQAGATIADASNYGLQLGLGIGAQYDGVTQFNGLLGPIRITKGVGRFTSAPPVPTAMFPLS